MTNNVAEKLHQAEPRVEKTLDGLATKTAESGQTSLQFDSSNNSFILHNLNQYFCNYGT